MGSGTRVAAIAADYDGTVADEGRVDPAVLERLEAFKKSGRKLVLVTGRELGELLSIFGGLGVFDRVIAENGALLYDPGTRAERVLGSPPPPALVDRLRAAGVVPLSIGRSIIATRIEFHRCVLAAIGELGLNWEVSLNKGAIMILPAQIDKGSGLNAALRDLGLSPRETAAIGDGENDLPLFKACGLRIALANSVPSLKKLGDFVAPAPAGRGVIEGIRWLMQND
jgi:hydroxymethylpyrimidine pyrophosphatase-like HAD family hydrolase